MSAATARQLLTEGGYTCVFCKDGTVHTSTERGVKPLVAFYRANTPLKGFAAADKVVGKGAAFLYVLLGVTALHANVISHAAHDLLVRHGIALTYDTLVPVIVNRAGNGTCPFEKAVLAVEDADEAYRVICAKLDELGIKV